MSLGEQKKHRKTQLFRELFLCTLVICVQRRRWLWPSTVVIITSTITTIHQHFHPSMHPFVHACTVLWNPPLDFLYCRNMSGSSVASINSRCIKLSGSTTEAFQLRENMSHQTKVSNKKCSWKEDVPKKNWNSIYMKICDESLKNGSTPLSCIQKIMEKHLSFTI